MRLFTECVDKEEKLSMSGLNSTDVATAASIENDITTGALVAAVLVALIIVVLLGFLLCAMVVNVRKRNRLARERRDVEAMFGGEGGSGLTILRGESFKRQVNRGESEETKHQVLSITVSPVATDSEGSVTLNHFDVNPYAVTHLGELEAITEGERGDSGLATSYNDLSYPQASVDSNLHVLEGRDYSEIEDIRTDTSPQYSIPRVPMPYIKPISVLPPNRREWGQDKYNGDDLSSTEGNRGGGYVDDGHYAQLCATLEQHLYAVPYSPTDINISNLGDSDSDSAGYASTILSTLGTMDIPNVDCSNFEFLRELGDGHFGRVYLAESVGLSLKDLRIDDKDTDTNVAVLVAVKSLKENSPVHTQCAFVKEVKLMSKLSHSHIVNLLGVCIKRQPFMVMEFMIHGDLKHYLQSCTFLTDNLDAGTVSLDGVKRQVTLSTLVSMCAQIADGMQYLSSLNLVHRDLAGRNCLVGANNVVKVGDFGMTRALHYNANVDTALPIRHIPYECFYGKFSEKSDVWSFGVTMWEVFTLGQRTPYKEMSNRLLAYDAMKGPQRQILQQPVHCPDELYLSAMRRCWEHKPQKRPPFRQLLRILQDFLYVISHQ